MTDNFVTDLGTDQLGLEARDERVRAQHQRVILARAALEQLAVDRALEVDHDLVAVLGLGALLAVVEGLGLAGQVLQRLVNGLVVGLHDQTVQLDLAGINLRDRGQRVVADLDHDILAFFPGIATDHLHVGLQRRAVAGLVEMLFHRAVDGFLHRVAQKTGAELLFQDRQRDLALAEALDLDVGLRFQKLFLDFRVQLSRRHRDGVAALQAFVQGLGDLHGGYVLPRSFGRDCAIACIARGKALRDIARLLAKLSFRCKGYFAAMVRQPIGAQREGLVRVKGLEPPCLAALEPKSSASTSFATPAETLALTPSSKALAGVREAIALPPALFLPQP